MWASPGYLRSHRGLRDLSAPGSHTAPAATISYTLLTYSHVNGDMGEIGEITTRRCATLQPGQPSRPPGHGNVTYAEIKLKVTREFRIDICVRGECIAPEVPLSMAAGDPPSVPFAAPTTCRQRAALTASPSLTIRCRFATSQSSSCTWPLVLVVHRSTRMTHRRGSRMPSVGMEANTDRRPVMRNIGWS